VTRKLLTASVLFFFVADAILSWFSYRSYFCSVERTGHSHVFTAARLAFAFTIWNFFAGWCGFWALAQWKKHSFTGQTVVAPILSTTIAGMGYISVPFWIYRGHGVFLFENTWADVSCFFTEGYGMIFLLVIAPALALTTLLCEWIFIYRKSQESI